jgi:hypothetical protein
MSGCSSAVLRHRVAQGPIDLAAAQACRVEARPTHPWPVEHLRRPVALVGYADDVFLQPQCNGDLGAAGKEGCNARHRVLSS